jgi:bacterioferritin-associated ferredoxin
MYVCVCHAVTEDAVREHVAAGACSAKDVRAACGMRPGCGSCVNRICALLKEGAAEPAIEEAVEVAA